jgi:hypothetical protein
MGAKKYSSFKEIDFQLEILKLEKEINYQKMVYSIEKTKENLEPQNLISEFVDSCKEALSKQYGLILQTVIPIVIKWLSKTKRGD